MPLVALDVEFELEAAPETVVPVADELSAELVELEEGDKVTENSSLASHQTSESIVDRVLPVSTWYETLSGQIRRPI